MALQFFAGDTLAAADLQILLPNVVMKSANQARASTIVPADDSEISAIALGVGTWEIIMRIFAFNGTSNVPGLATRWGFTGTANAPVRHCQGPGSSQVAASSGITDSFLRGVPTGTSTAYGLAANSSYAEITESTANFVVTSLGNLSLQWSQAVSGTGATTIAGESYVSYRQIA
jgi:hypothetical protein